MGDARGLFDPEPEPGDRRKQIVALIFALIVVLAVRLAIGRVGMLLLEAVVGLVLLVPVVAGLARLLR